MIVGYITRKGVNGYYICAQYEDNHTERHSSEHYTTKEEAEKIEITLTLALAGLSMEDVDAFLGIPGIDLDTE